MVVSWKLMKQNLRAAIAEDPNGVYELFIKRTDTIQMQLL